jgi:NAD(P)-dependent dehydrogenase (short-subunit alcohol dehydrogenase family)
VLSLEGKVAVSTGGASGIGRAVAEQAGALGMRLVLADIEAGPLDEAVAALTAAGAEVTGRVTDVADGASVEALRDHALERFGAVHLLHNNAGVGGGGGPLWTISEADWRWTLDVNLWGVIHGVRAFVPLLVEQGEGHVVNTASLAGLTSPPLMGCYNASKHAVVALSETLFKDLRTVGSPVGVSVLCPGFVRTGIGHSDRNRPAWAPAPPEEEGSLDGFIRQLVAGGIEPSEVATAVLDAVQRDDFYIITHPETDPMVGSRFHDIMERRTPRVRPVS